MSTFITHESIPIFIDDNSSVLILGSLPSVKSREEGFYYAHKQNRFFRVLSRLFNEDEPLTVEKRKLFLRRHNIALYDVIYSCYITGSSDSSIKEATPIDLEDILSRYPNIKVIGVNGDKAKQVFDRYLIDIAISHNIEVIYLPSTSPANAKTSLDYLLEKYTKLFI